MPRTLPSRRLRRGVRRRAGCAVPRRPRGARPTGDPCRRGVRVGSLVARVVGAAVLAFVLLVTSTALAIWWNARQDARPVSDAIVVLGSAQYNGVPSSIFEARLEHALKLYDDGVAPVVVTVGGKKSGDQFTEAEAGRDYLATAGIPTDALLAVRGGVDTLESMKLVA